MVIMLATPDSLDTSYISNGRTNRVSIPWAERSGTRQPENSLLCRVHGRRSISRGLNTEVSKTIQEDT
jgi:hypothetical protein